MSDRIRGSETEWKDGPDLSDRYDGSRWEISLDDYEETRDLAEAAARIAKLEDREKAREQAEEMSRRFEKGRAGNGERHVQEEWDQEAKRRVRVRREEAFPDSGIPIREKEDRAQDKRERSREKGRYVPDREERDQERYVPEGGRRTWDKEGRLPGERGPVRERDGHAPDEREAVRERDDHDREEDRDLRVRKQKKDRTRYADMDLDPEDQGRPSGHRKVKDHGDAEDRPGKKKRRNVPERDREDRDRGRRMPSGRRPSRKKQENPVLAFWNGLQPMDKVVGFTGIAVCLFAVLTFSVVVGVKGTDRQVAAFAEVGENMSQITVAGEGTFLAVADAHVARQQAVEDLEQQQEEETYEEVEDTSDVQVGLNMTSVEKDLKIKFVNRKTGKLIPHVDFQVEIKGPDKTWQETDGDKDGIIYLTGLTGGNYTVRIVGPQGLTGYGIPADAQSVTVKGQIEYKKIDVSDEIKKESEVNAAKEDTQVKIPVESVIQDSVEWVESTKTPIGGDGSAYEEIKKEEIPDPAATASREYALFAGMKSGMGSGLIQGQGTGWTVMGLSAATAGGMERSQPGGTDTPPEPSSEPSSLEPSSSEPSSLEPSSPEPSSSEASSEPLPSEPSSSEPSPSESSTVPKPEKVKVTGITVSNSSVNVKVGGNVSVTAGVVPANATDSSLEWSSSNADVASVSGGTITGKSVGTATITVRSPDGPTASIAVTVSADTVKPTQVNISGGNSISVGGTLKLTAALVPADSTGGAVKWSSSNTGVAKVDNTGLVSGVGAGTAVITVEVEKESGSKETVTGTATITVVAGKSFTMRDMTLAAGETKKADYTATGDIVSTTFSIANTKFATVDTNGNIRAIRAGETKYTVTVKFRDGSTSSDTKKLTVRAASVSGITLDKTSVTLKVGETLKLNPKIETGGYTGCLWYTSDMTVVSVEEHGNGTVKALKPGKAIITACSSEDTSKKATCEVTVLSDKDPRTDTTTPLKDKNGNRLYYKDGNGKYVEAVVADYYKYNVFYRLKENVEYIYTGWQTIDGKRYYFDKNGNKVTGEQTIQGIKYTFGGDGALNAGSGVLGIDVSRHNGNINWAEVKNSGVSFVIIRCGYRGSATGAMIEDQKFRTNIQGATAAGLKVGIYFFSQAVNRVEAVEEASMTIDLIKNYKISYPVFLDVEAAGGRADGIDTGTRTEIINTYCQTIQNSGYTAGVYANKTWLGSKMSVGSLGGCRIWLAQYAAAPTYNGRYEMWQYSSKGRIGGISTDVDLNISYLGY